MSIDLDSALRMYKNGEIDISYIIDLDKEREEDLECKNLIEEEYNFLVSGLFDNKLTKKEKDYCKKTIDFIEETYSSYIHKSNCNIDRRNLNKNNKNK